MEQYIKRLTDLSKQLRDILNQVSSNKNNPAIMNAMKSKTQAITNEINGICNQVKARLKISGENYSGEAVGELVKAGEAGKGILAKSGKSLKSFGHYVDAKITTALKKTFWLVTSPLRGLYNITKWAFITFTLVALGSLIGDTYIKSKKISEAKRAYDGTGGLEEYSPKRLCIYDSPAYEYFLQTV